MLHYGVYEKYLVMYSRNLTILYCIVIKKHFRGNGYLLPSE